jgi:RimJ/RimL family protein N-acetyltransferase
MIVCETERLIIQHFQLSDAEYIVKQLNEESFIKFIADKQVRTIEDAENYLNNGPMASYQNFGFGLNLVLLKKNSAPIGICGLVKRDELEHPDIGYAFLPEYWGEGYAIEASKEVLTNAVNTLNLKKILGITHPDNKSSNKILTRLGFTQTGSVELYDLSNNLYEYKVNS